MKNISFALTTPQFLDRSKDVTRRLGWKDLKAGDILCGVERVMGFKPGEKIKRLGLIRVVSARREPLTSMWLEPYGTREAAREGFPDLTGAEFVLMFCKHMSFDESIDVTRIEYEYLEQGD